MVKIAKWHVGSLAGLAILVAAAMLFAKEIIAPSVYGVCTVGYNYREWPIYWFGVSTSEGKCGNNTGGKRPDETYGGGVACGCVVRPGGRATVKWTMEQTRAEFDSHAPIEKHEIQVTVPQPESRKSRYLQVHFLANNDVVLDWRDEVDNRVKPATERVDERQH
ncbi:DUF3304 domain-containing protein [Burkholderia sp. L27(2015)]|uniref:DUF3304 domain-containing protein n=1 Tax=Burkholderia sp. L27(2015) TaxID=1641858 RepID=UPI00131DA13E|nr:DUF3304 domain-containing protein [Burkholderia sp. L27(2015)]